MSAPVKCVVWDLDNTLWTGVLVEGAVAIRREVADVVRTLDQRGIVNSIASRNDSEVVAEALDRLGLSEYFVYPQVGWGAKSAAVAEVARRTNLGLDSIVFVDDDPFERAEVRANLPAVTCVSPDELLDVQTDDRYAGSTSELAQQRRSLYQAEEERQALEASSGLSRVAFLRSLQLEMLVREAGVEDLARCAELTVRTHQLNTTGIVLSEDEIRAKIESDEHRVIVASLTDRFGSYGIIGLAVVADDLCGTWRLELLLTSCRVLSRGAGGALLRVIMLAAEAAGATLYAELNLTARNRIMLVTLRFAGFVEQDEVGPRGGRLLRAPTGRAPQLPDHLAVEVNL